MNNPAVAVDTHADSATTVRISRLEAAGLKISRTTIEVLRVAGTTNSCVRPWRAIATDDPERPSVACSKALKDFEESGVRADELARLVVTKLAPREVRAQVSH